MSVGPYGHVSMVKGHAVVHVAVHVAVCARVETQGL